MSGRKQFFWAAPSAVADFSGLETARSHDNPPHHRRGANAPVRPLAHPPDRRPHWKPHFHVFGSRWHSWHFTGIGVVLISATVVVAADHFLRGAFWLSINWRADSQFLALARTCRLGHFEDFFLLISIAQSQDDLHQVAERQAGLEAVNESIEQQGARTHTRTQGSPGTHQTQSKLEETHLNPSVSRPGLAWPRSPPASSTTSTTCSTASVCPPRWYADRLLQSEVGDLHRAASMLQGKNGQLAQFLTADPKGKLVPNSSSSLPRCSPSSAMNWSPKWPNWCNTSGTLRKSSPCGKITPRSFWRAGTRASGVLHSPGCPPHEYRGL